MLSLHGLDDHFFLFLKFCFVLFLFVGALLLLFLINFRIFACALIVQYLYNEFVLKNEYQFMQSVVCVIIFVLFCIGFICCLFSFVFIGFSCVCCALIVRLFLHCHSFVNTVFFKILRVKKEVLL